MPEIRKNFNLDVAITFLWNFSEKFWHNPQNFEVRSFDQILILVSKFRSRLHLCKLTFNNRSEISLDTGSVTTFAAEMGRLSYFAIQVQSWFVKTLSNRGEHGQDQDWISCRILAIFSDQDWIWILVWFLQLNFSESDSRCHKLWWQCFLCYVFILSVCAALITINDHVTSSLIFSAKWK